jgi:hypothetical protein
VNDRHDEKNCAGQSGKRILAHLLSPPKNVMSMRHHLRFAAFFSRRQRTRMPLLILDVAFAEPPPAPTAVHGRQILAGLMARRHGLTQPYQLRTSWLFFVHQEPLIPTPRLRTST